MAWFEGSHTETRTLSIPLAKAREHFAHPETIIAATKGVESSSVDDGVIHFVLKEEDHGVVKFKGDYRCRYELDGNTLRWTTLGESNLKQSGEAVFAEQGGQTELAYTETVEIDLGVPGLMAPMLQPVIGPMLAAEVKAYVERVVNTLA